VRLRDGIFHLLEHEGAIALPRVPEVRDLTAVEMRDLFGMRGAAECLGVSMRSMQRYVAAETGSAAEIRRPRPFRVRLMREAGIRELRRAGADRLRGGFTLPDGTSIHLCYDDEDQGTRDVGGEQLSNDAWLDAFARGDAAETRGDQPAADRFYDEMVEEFSRSLLDNYGDFPPQMHICDDEEDALDLPF